MKYLNYIGIVLWTLIRKIVGLLWFFIAVPFRGYARNVVYNYVLDNDVYLKRLLERPITKYDDFYTIGEFNGATGGSIKRREISKLEYQLVYWLIWGWLDDDSQCDTTSKVFMEEFLSNKRNNQLHHDSSIEKCIENCEGNSFEKGDDLKANWCGWMSILWLVRNTAYNFKYMQHEMRSDDKNAFLVEIFGYGFGWRPDKYEPHNCSLVIGSK